MPKNQSIQSKPRRARAARAAPSALARVPTQPAKRRTQAVLLMFTKNWNPLGTQ